MKLLKFERNNRVSVLAFDKYIKLLSYLTIFYLTFILSSNLYADPCYRDAKNLSDALPTSLVQSFLRSHLWKNSYDNPRTSRQLEIVQNVKSFWRILSAPQVNQRALFGNMFGSIDSMSPEKFFPEIYGLKVAILSFALKSDNQLSSCLLSGTQNINKVYQNWQEYYIKILVEYLQLANIPEYTPIIESFENSIENHFLNGKQKKNPPQDSLNILNLTAEVREKYQHSIKMHKSADLLRINPATGFYEITGFYNPSQNIIAIDFSRPISDTFVTFAHEIVHSSSPEIVNSRKKLEKLTQAANKTISKLIDEKQFNYWAQSLINHLLFETGITAEPAQKLMFHLIDVKKEQLKTRNLELDKLGVSWKVGKKEDAVLREFIETSLHLTLGNEFKAYSLSILAYVKLKDSKGLLAPVQYREDQVEKILKGDQFFAANIFFDTQLHVLQNIESQYEAKKKELQDEEKLKAKSKGVSDSTESSEKNILATLMKLERTLNHLEIIYFEEVKAYISHLKTNYAEQISEIRKYNSADWSDIPYYIRPGGLESPDNPYLPIFEAKLTTSWILRFQSNLETIIDELLSYDKALLAAKAKITYLSDLDEVDLRLVGVKYADSKYDPSNYSRTEVLRGSLDGDSYFSDYRKEKSLWVWNPQLVYIPSEYLGYFQVTPWDLRKNALPISGVDLNKKLVKLRLIKIHHWLQMVLPTYNGTIVRNLSFLNKLQSGEYDTNEISNQKAQELISVISENIQSTQTILNFSNRIGVLFSMLENVLELSQSEKLTEIAKETKEQMELLKKSASALNIKASENINKMEHHFKAQLFNFHDANISLYEDCLSHGQFERESTLGRQQKIHKDVSLDMHMLGITFFCSQKQLLSMSLPANKFTNPITLIDSSGSGQPVTYLGDGARPIIIEAYNPKYERNIYKKDVEESREKHTEKKSNKFLWNWFGSGSSDSSSGKEEEKSRDSSKSRGSDSSGSPFDSFYFQN